MPFFGGDRASVCRDYTDVEGRMRYSSWQESGNESHLDESTQPVGDYNGDNRHDHYNGTSDEVIIDQLISNLNGKLTLKSKPCHSLCKQKRLSPYSTNSHTIECTNYHLLNNNNANTADLNDLNPPNVTNGGDAYLLMQQLLKEGTLIKEAVRRLQYSKNGSVAF